MTALSLKTSALLKMSSVSIAEQFLTNLTSVLASIVMAQVGKNELAAVALVNSLFGWLRFLFLGFCVGSSVIISRLYGEENYEGVKDATRQSLYVTLFTSILVVILIFALSKQLFALFFSSATPEIMQSVKKYFPYAIISLPFLEIQSILNVSARAVGDNKTSLISNFTINTLHAILSYTFVFGICYLGYESMSIAGVGLSVLIVSFFGPITSYISIRALKTPILPKNIFKKGERNYIGRMLNIGTFSAFENAFLQGGLLVFQVVMLKFAAEVQSGFSVAATVNGLFMSVTNGVAVMLTPIISQKLAQHKFDESLSINKASQRLVYSVLLSIGIIMFIVSPLVARFFSSDQTFIHSSTIFIMLLGVIFCFESYAAVKCAILRGAGDAKYITFVSIISVWLFRLLPSWILSKYTNGYIAVGIGLTLDYIGRAILYHIRISKNKWLYIKV